MLPEDVVAQIRSSAVITSLNSVALGLVRNALDAKATKVNVSVDFLRANCSAEDNGLGIPPTDFSEAGNLGKAYCTSKHPRSPDNFGKHGVFLSSVAALSLVTVTSHHHLYNSHNSLSIHGSQTITRHTPALPDQRILTFPHGTRVTVRDLFGSMPVRVKQRAMTAEKSGFSREWDSLVMSMIALILAYPKSVTLLVRNATTQQTMSLRSSGLDHDPKSASTSTSASHVLRTTSLLKQACLSDLVDGKHWVPVRAASALVRLDGCVALTPVATKRIQFITVGNEPLVNDGQANILFDEINRIFASSDFGVMEEVDAVDEPTRDNTGQLSNKEMRARKGVDRWPMFHLSITLDGSEKSRAHVTDDIVDGSERSLAGLLDLIAAMFHEFLKKNHFRPRTSSRHSPREVVLASTRASSMKFSPDRDDLSALPSDHGGTARVSKSTTSQRAQSSSRSISSNRLRSRTKSSRRASRSESPFAMWALVKYGRSRDSGTKSESDSVPPSKRTSAKSTADAMERMTSKSPRLVAPTGHLLRRPFDTEAHLVPAGDDSRPSSPHKAADKSEAGRSHSEGYLTWTDPLSKVKSVIDSNTGFVVKDDRGPQRTTRVQAASSESGGKTLTCTGASTPSWLAEIQSTWKNPVYESSELPIPRIAESFGGLGTASGKMIRPGKLLEFDSVGEQTAMYMEKHISKDALRRAVVVAQVDRKFILIRIPARTSSDQHREGNADLMVLVDQHAADERYRLESLMQEYFSFEEGEQDRFEARTDVLQRPLVFELPRQEYKFLTQYRTYFEKWGIVYDVGIQDVERREKSSMATATVTIRRLPPSVLERCRTEPKLLIELIRNQIWKLAEGQHHESMPMASQPSSNEQAHWISRFHGCPDGIVDLLHSRSCRSK